MMRTRVSRLVGGISHPLSCPNWRRGAQSSLLFSQTNFNRERIRGIKTPIPPQAYEQNLLNVTTLSNGLRVATQKTHDETATIGVWLNCGSRSEHKENNGTAHFLEHMAFRGTKTRSQHQLEKEIENMGAHLNAYTSREQTVYYAKVFKKDVAWAADILSDILSNSLYQEEAIEVERQVIQREFEEVNKSNEETLLDYLHQIAFRDSALGFTILGPVENIQSISREQLVDYVNRHYKSDKMVLVAVGNVEHADVVKMAEEKFGKFQPSPAKSQVAAPSTKPYFLGCDLAIRNDTMGPIAHCSVAMEGVSYKSPDALVFMLMQAIIGCYKRDEGIVPGIISGNTSIHRIANKMNYGCAESFAAFNTHYRDTGLFGWYAQCDEVAVTHCMEELMFSITALSYSVTEEEVHRAKQQLKTQLFGSLDCTTAIAEDIGRQLLVCGRRISPLEFLTRLESIDADEVKRVAWNRLHDAEVAVALTGPIHGYPGLYALRRATSWYRY